MVEVIRAFERASGMKVPYEIVARRAGDVASTYASSDRARQMLGWQAKLGLDEMCDSAWRWQQYCAQL